jgi:hypothetical protein
MLSAKIVAQNPGDRTIPPLSPGQTNFREVVMVTGAGDEVCASQAKGASARNAVHRPMLNPDREDTRRNIRILLD